MNKKKVIVVGAGAAGLMAAGQVAERGAEVIVLEKMQRPALKLRITGKGRCNLTNIAPLPEFIERFDRNGRFLHQAFSRFFSSDLVTFVESLGVATVEERGGRVFPASSKAEEVVDALLRWATESGAEIRCNSCVTGIMAQDRAVTGIQFTQKGARSKEAGQTDGAKTERADAIIITTG
ncbi:MAG: NAD(P)/FAD-dependent oxidoreductase, partial [Planctomycetota bacterium]